MRRDVQIEKLTQDMRMLKSEISKVEAEDDTVRQLTEEIELLTKEMAQFQSDAAREKEDLITQNGTHKNLY
jgi:prefoldin subunit 5